MGGISEQVRRCQMSDALRSHLETTIEKRVDRYMEVSPQLSVPNHHFAAASDECIRLYTDGYFLSTVMVTQAVAEAIRRFVVERNEIKTDDKMQCPEIVELLVTKGIISNDCAAAFKRIWRSFRNDVHHMNPPVATIDFPKLAKRNIQDLAAIERKIFAFKTTNGRFIPTNPKHWDTRKGNIIMSFFVRFGP